MLLNLCVQLLQEVTREEVEPERLGNQDALLLAEAETSGAVAEAGAPLAREGESGGVPGKRRARSPSTL